MQKLSERLLTSSHHVVTPYDGSDKVPRERCVGQSLMSSVSHQWVVMRMDEMRVISLIDESSFALMSHRARRHGQTLREIDTFPVGHIKQAIDAISNTIECGIWDSHRTFVFFGSNVCDVVMCVHVYIAIIMMCMWSGSTYILCNVTWCDVIWCDKSPCCPDFCMCHSRLLARCCHKIGYVSTPHNSFLESTIKLRSILFLVSVTPTIESLFDLFVTVTSFIQPLFNPVVTHLFSWGFRLPMISEDRDGVFLVVWGSRLQSSLLKWRWTWGFVVSMVTCGWETLRNVCLSNVILNTLCYVYF